MTLQFSKTQKQFQSAMTEATKSIPPLPPTEEELNTLSTPPKINTVSMDELLGMSLNDARNALQRAVVIVATRNRFSPYYGKAGVMEFLQLLRDTDPNRDVPETLQKEMHQ